MLRAIFARPQESDGGCEGSDAEMIGNGRRGAGAGDRDLEEDEDEGREERSSESGGGGGFGGWKSHLFGGLTQRVKSWYWGTRPLVSFLPTSSETAKQHSFSLALYFLCLFLSFYKTRTISPVHFYLFFFFISYLRPIRSASDTLHFDSRKSWEGKGVRRKENETRGKYKRSRSAIAIENSLPLTLSETRFFAYNNIRYYFKIPSLRRTVCRPISFSI